MILLAAFGAFFGLGIIGKNRGGCGSCGFRLLVLFRFLLFFITAHLTFGHDNSP